MQFGGMIGKLVFGYISNLAMSAEVMFLEAIWIGSVYLS